MLKVALAQLNTTVGDLVGNARLIEQAARQAHAQGARVVLTPELSLCGYPPEDLLLRPSFMAAVEAQLQALAHALADLPELVVLVGHPHNHSPDGGARTRSTQVPDRFNAVSALQAGQVLGRHAKQKLPNYQVFDERRYFSTPEGDQAQPLVLTVGGIRLGVLVCEDAWFDSPGLAAAKAGAQVLCVLNASPYHLDKGAEREARMAQLALRTGCAVLWCHSVGGQDELVFDGASFAVNAQGEVCARAPSFAEHLLVLSLDTLGQPEGPMAPRPEPLRQLWDALVTGVRDYVGKNGFPSVIIGLSGGVDSALVLAVAVDALGPSRVRTVMMPSPYTADMSWIDARDMADRLGVRHEEWPIAGPMQAFEQVLAPSFAGLPADTTEENLQARIRGTLLMALSNKTGAIVLTTGNKSEMATGYCTLYGDMAGGFAVIKDLVKTRVWDLCRWRNQQPHPTTGVVHDIIPARIISRPPSAELRPDQVDQDSLPPYEVLDAVIGLYVEEDRSVDDIVAAGFDRDTVEQVVRLIRVNEYKRRQSPVGIRLTHRAFAKDWRYPITSKFRG